MISLANGKATTQMVRPAASSPPSTPPIPAPETTNLDLTVALPGITKEQARAVQGTVCQWMQDAFAKYARQDALRWKAASGWTGVTYTKLAELAKHFSLGLTAMGVNRADKVAIISKNRFEWPIADLGALHCGAVTVPIYDTLPAGKAAYILNDSQSKVCIASTEEQLRKILEAKPHCDALQTVIVMDKLKEMPEGVIAFEEVLARGREHEKRHPDAFETSWKAVKPTDLATLIYTSGTTAEPKGVMLTHNNFVANIVAVHSVVPFEAGWHTLSYLPLSHSFERSPGYYTILTHGLTINYAESIEKIPANMTEVRPHVMTSVPRLYEKMYARIMENRAGASWLKGKIFDWAVGVGKEATLLRMQNKPIPPGLAKKLKRADRLVFSKIKARTGGRLVYFFSGGAALAPAIEEFLNAVGVTVYQGYGLTETSPVLTCNRPGNSRLGSVGKPIPGVEIKIAEDGEIWARGPNIMTGYWNKRAETEEALTKDGWFKTGDIGRVDEDGFVFITDRKKEIIVMSNGKKVTPQPIENDLKTKMHVAQAVLIGNARNYITALLVPNFESLAKWAAANKVGATDPVALIQNAKVQELMRKNVEEVNTTLARYEQLKKFRLLPRELNIEEDELTPSMKVKRRVLDTKYKDLIEEMYKE